jgi:hypothetical protein
MKGFGETETLAIGGAKGSLQGAKQAAGTGKGERHGSELA